MFVDREEPRAKTVVNAMPLEKSAFFHLCGIWNLVLAVGRYKNKVM